MGSSAGTHKMSTNPTVEKDSSWNCLSLMYCRKWQVSVLSSWRQAKIRFLFPSILFYSLHILAGNACYKIFRILPLPSQEKTEREQEAQLQEEPAQKAYNTLALETHGETTCPKGQQTLLSNIILAFRSRSRVLSACSIGDSRSHGQGLRRLSCAKLALEVCAEQIHAEEGLTSCWLCTLRMNQYIADQVN